MHARIATLALVVVGLPLSGCVQSPAIGYAKPRLPDAQVVVLKAGENSAYHSRFYGFAMDDGSEQPTWKGVGSRWLGYPDELHLRPGTYTIRVHCVTPNNQWWSVPHFSGTFEAGTTYYVDCFTRSPRTGMIGAKVFRYHPTPRDPDQKQ